MTDLRGNFIDYNYQFVNTVSLFISNYFWGFRSVKIFMKYLFDVAIGFVWSTL